MKREWHVFENMVGDQKIETTGRDRKLGGIRQQVRSQNFPSELGVVLFEARAVQAIEIPDTDMTWE